MFSLHPKLPNRSVFGLKGVGGGGGLTLFNQFAWPPSCFSLATVLLINIVWYRAIDRNSKPFIDWNLLAKQVEPSFLNLTNTRAHDLPRAEGREENCLAQVGKK